MNEPLKLQQKVEQTFTQRPGKTGLMLQVKKTCCMLYHVHTATLF